MGRELVEREKGAGGGGKLDLENANPECKNYFQSVQMHVFSDIAVISLLPCQTECCYYLLILSKQISGHYSLEDRHLGRLYFGILKLNKEYSA